MMQAGRIGGRSAAAVSVAIVVAVWMLAAARSLVDQDSIREIAASVPRLALHAGGRGVLTLLIIVGLLRLAGERFRDLGLVPDGVAKQLAVGLGFGVAIFLVDQIAVAPILGALVPPTADTGIDMAALFGDPRQYPLWILLVVLKGGFVEELWRICGVTRFERAGGRAGLVIAVLLGSGCFGIGHLYQGVDGALGTAIQAVLYTLVYLRRRRALEAIAAHAVFDVIGVTLGYLIYS